MWRARHKFCQRGSRRQYLKMGRGSFRGIKFNTRFRFYSGRAWSKNNNPQKSQIRKDKYFRSFWENINFCTFYTLYPFSYLIFLKSVDMSIMGPKGAVSGQNRRVWHLENLLKILKKLATLSEWKFQSIQQFLGFSSVSHQRGRGSK